MVLALPLLLAAAIGTMGVVTIAQLDSSTQDLVDRTAAKAVGFVSAAENKTRLYQLAFAALATPELAGALLEDVNGNVGELTETLAALAPLITPVEQADFATLQEGAPKLMADVQQHYQLVLAGKLDEADALLKGAITDDFDGLDGAFDSLNAIEQLTLSTAKADAHTDALDAQIAVGAVFGVGLLLATTVAFWLSRTQMVRPVRAISASMTRIAEGNLDELVPGTGRGDEFGAMAEAVEVFRQNALRIASLGEEERARSVQAGTLAAEGSTMGARLTEAVTAAARGDFSLRLPTSYSQQNLSALSGTVNQLLETISDGLDETSSVLSALAQTDLTHRVTGVYQGAFARLKSDTNAVADKLGEIVGQLKETSRGLKTATGEILSGANDLSERTTKQAATIEETSAAMEQLATTVLQNADRAKEASSVSGHVTRTAEEGGKVMGEATTAMERITQSSAKISNIIGLIDDIAFQTNLLALNASVEAARAGDAGKGFAVVAVEVRRLAQSAASASSEVKVLIDQSSGEVKTGSKLVADAASRLQSMLEAARSSNELMDGIARESRQQASSIEEVNTAIRQLDEMTQHNAALVEQTNAAIEQTEAQANDLDRIVDVFTLEEAPTATQKPATQKKPAAFPSAPAHGIKGLQEKVKRAASSYLSHGNAAVDKDWAEF